MTEKHIICSVCNGKGKYRPAMAFDFYICRRCGGSGKMTICPDCKQLKRLDSYENIERKWKGDHWDYEQ
jgi:DnaJ-class molecular chaperone